MFILSNYYLFLRTPFRDLDLPLDPLFLTKPLLLLLLFTSGDFSSGVPGSSGDFGSGVPDSSEDFGSGEVAATLNSVLIGS